MFNQLISYRKIHFRSDKHNCNKGNKYNKNFIQCLICLVGVCVLFANCKREIEIGAPSTSINSKNVYATEATAASVLTGVYTKMSSGSFSLLQGVTSISLFAGLSADELSLYNLGNSSYRAYFRNDLSVNIAGSEAWSSIYPLIFTCNSAIEGLNITNSISNVAKDRLLGEAKFLRAFFYFYLVNLYGDVPLALTTDFTVNASLPRSSQSDVYKQIIADLKEAQSLLPADYVEADMVKISSERIRPNKWSAIALLARTYLYSKSWADAESAASNVINNNSTFSLSELSKVFLKSSLGNKEAIWQLQPVLANQNTQDARLFILPSGGPNTSVNPVFLSPTLIASFESGDLRKDLWTGNKIVTVSSMPITYYFPTKYKISTNTSNVTEYSMVLRLAEQYLIRAEARAQLGQIDNAKNDLNYIRQRAGLGIKDINNKDSLLLAIMQERRSELFTEWGHRWLDLKRMNVANIIMSTAATTKGGTWASYSQLYPIRLIDLQNDPNLSQNPGY